MHVRTLAKAVFVAVIAVALAGCSQVKSQMEAKYIPKPKVITIEATVAAVGAPVVGTVPAAFPAGLPMWPKSKVVKSKIEKTKRITSYSLTTTTQDPYADVLAGLGKGLTDAGWKASSVDATTANQKVAIITVSNSANEGVITVSQMTGKPVRVDYLITPKK